MNIAVNEFDRLFDSVVAVSAQPKPEPAPRRASEEAETRINTAVALFHQGDYRRCNLLLRNCNGEAACDPRARAFLAASHALVTGRVRDGLVACIQEIRSAFYIPDLYCALGVLLLRSGERSKAYAAFQRGLRLDQHHMGIKARVRDMGLRRSPVLPFLSRRHPANRVLGVVRARICRA